MHETEDRRIFTVLDSWVRSDGEEKKASSVSLRILWIVFNERPLTGTMQISWSEVMNSFHGVYLSWDPDMWPHSLAFHGYPLLSS